MPKSGLIRPKVLGKKNWPPNYPAVHEWRGARLKLFRENPGMLIGALEYYAKPENAIEFIVDWCDTYDPRNAGIGLMTRLPLVLFEKQAELVEFLLELIKDQQSGLIDKSRDMGATWVCCAFSIWMWLFIPGSSIGWGSRKQELVDKLGDLDSIFEKLRQLVRGLPREFLPLGFSYDKHLSFERILNPENGASITGEVGDNIGRGGRKSIYFKDESAHYEHPELIEAALGDNTRVQVDISTVNGVGTVYDRRRESAVEWRRGRKIEPGMVRMLVMDWSDHPAKTVEWYKERETKAKREGLIHVFRQEVDRNAAAALQGVIIPPEWVNAAVDAHKKIKNMESGGWCGALDVADPIEGNVGDLHALTLRKGVVLRFAEDRGEGDVGQAARWAITTAIGYGQMELQYDSVGIGAGVKSEYNRLKEERKLPHGITLVPWSAGAKVLKPEAHIIPGDPKTPTNEDYFKNLKAQGWWALRRRFEKTYQVLEEGIDHDPDELISLPSNLPLLHKVKRELSQPTFVHTPGKLQIVVDKKPDGAKSPNLGDSIMMNYFPLLKGVVVSKEAMANVRKRLMNRRPAIRHRALA